MTDPNEFLSSLKMDLYPDEVYTFTPKGKVVVVPADGTPVDFAYTIHTEVGHTCVGAKVNGRMVPLRTKLRTGDIVEIVTQKDHKPSRDWLTFVKSPRARNKIKHWLNEDQRRRAVEIGRKLLEREARKFKVPMTPDRRPGSGPHRRRIRRSHRGRSAGDAWARASTPRTRCSTSWRRDSPTRLMARNRTEPSRPAPSSRPCPTRCASCTSPVPIRSRSKARTICSSIARAVATPFAAKRSSATSRAARESRCTRAVVPTCRTCSMRATAASTWSGRASAMIAADPQRYPVKITVYCDDRTGMLKELTAVISDDNTNIRGVDIHHDDNGEAIIEFVVEAEDLRHLNRMVLGIRRVSGVRTVQRTQKL